MKIIKTSRTRKDKELPITARMIESAYDNGILYEVQYCAKDNNEWITPDYGPGGSGWAFRDKSEALAFWDDLFTLTQEQMAEKYEAKGRWVS